MPLNTGKDSVQLLVDILLDKTAREDERDDAAIDLREYKDVRAWKALIKIASNSQEEHTLIDNCAESIGEIWNEMNYFNEQVFETMVPFAQKIIFGFIMAHKPMLINKKFKNEFFAKEKNRQ